MMTLGVTVKEKERSKLKRLGERVFGIWFNNVLGVIVLMSALIMMMLKEFDIAIGLTIFALCISITRLVFIKNNNNLGIKIFNVVVTILYLLALILLNFFINAQAEASHQKNHLNNIGGLFLFIFLIDSIKFNPSRTGISISVITM